MAQPAISKLASACTSIVADATEAMSRNVMKSQEMSRNVAVKRENGKTNPRPTTGKRLSPRQLTAIGLLLCGDTVACAARRLRINPRTIFRWREDPQFLAEIDRRAEAVMPRCNASAPVRKVRPVAMAPRQTPPGEAEEQRKIREDLEWLNDIAEQAINQAQAQKSPTGSTSRNVR